MEWSEKRRCHAVSALFAALAAFFVSCGEDKIVASGDLEVRRFSDLPACNAAYEGLLARVKDWDTDYFCNGEVWVLRGEKPSKCDSNGIMTDYRDGKSYRCLDWGHGVWMIDDLILGKFESGGNRQGSATTWTEACKHCVNDDTTCTDGALYAWTTALLIDTVYDNAYVEGLLSLPHRGLCPTGWHVPTEKEFLDAAPFMTYMSDNKDLMFLVDSVMYANRAAPDDGPAEKFRQRRIWVLPEGRDRKSPTCHLIDKECTHYFYEKPETGTAFFQQSYDKDWYEEHLLRCVQD